MCLVLMVQAQGIKPRDTLAGTSVRVASSSITPLFVAFAKLIHLNHVSGLTCRPVLVLRALHIDILDVGVSTYSTAPPSHLGVWLAPPAASSTRPALVLLLAERYGKAPCGVLPPAKTRIFGD